MSTIEAVSSKATYNRLFGVLTDDVRRRIVRILRRRAGPVTEERLAELLADGDDSMTVDRVRVRLRHVHLPKLDESGFVAWDEDEATVSQTIDNAVGREGVDTLLAVEDEDGSLAAALADEQRRAVVEALAAAEGPLDLTTLAQRITDPDDESSAAVDDVAVHLHHQHLPRLADAGLIEYDLDDSSVTYVGPPAVSALLPAGT